MEQIDGQPRLAGVLLRTARWMVPAYLLLFLPLLVDRLDPATEPWFDLTGNIALIAWVFAESGQTLGITAMAGALLVLMAIQPGPSHRNRWTMVAVMIVVSLLILYGGKLFNDHVVKPALGIARPNIVQMADTGVLALDVDGFYALTKEARSDYLDSIKSDDGFGPLEMRPQIRDHWVKETAFSRPSGHALASMTFATFYLSMALTYLSGWRRWPFFLLVPWAVLVSLSRPILRVHWSADILIGGFAGIVIGGCGYFLTQFTLDRLDRRSTRLEQSPTIDHRER